MRSNSPLSRPGAGRLPEWLRKPFVGARPRAEVRALLRRLNLHTVCESANCPNLCECWRRKAATFLLLGDVCTRDCRFCAVEHGLPKALDPDEPSHVAEAVVVLGLRFVVLTCVTRDDLADGGASQIAATLEAISNRTPSVGIEVLTSDFMGCRESIAAVMRMKPAVFNHNIETTERLTPLIRNRADYRRSLGVLDAASELGRGQVVIKSGFMLGLGESETEIRQMLEDLRVSGVQILTMGQYLPPSRKHWPLDRYVPPAEFDEWGRIAHEEYGFESVVSGPLVRSSYKAAEALDAVRAGRRED